MSLRNRAFRVRLIAVAAFIEAEAPQRHISREAAKEKGDGYWAIGVDKCQHESGVDKSEKKQQNSVLACMIKRVDTGVFKATSDAMNGKFAGGKQIELGLAEDGVGVCPDAAKTASKAAMALVEKYKKLIISGKIVVPTDPKKVK